MEDLLHIIYKGELTTLCGLIDEVPDAPLEETSETLKDVNCQSCLDTYYVRESKRY